MSEVYENSVKAVAERIADSDKNINLIYAFNGSGKTRLSVLYKDVSKERNGGKHSGVYYNAYSEDLFKWNNDEESDSPDVRLIVERSTLNDYHSLIDEINVGEKLKSYKPNFDFFFEYHEDENDGIKSVKFTNLKEDKEKGKGDAKENDPSKDRPAIKISRGEEQIFKWCFFLTLFDVEGWTGDDKQSTHFFIDDPVSSLDDHNIFVTVTTIMDLIDRHFKNRKILITTHHFGFISILHNWLTKGEKASTYKNSVETFILKKNEEVVDLLGPKKDVFLYHLELLKILYAARDEKKLYAYHFGILRQVLENIGSFLGAGRISFVLEQLGITDTDRIAQIVNVLTHKNVFRFESVELVPDNVEIMEDILNKIETKYSFVLHA